MKIPTTPLARRIAAICHRRPTTPWNDVELRAYKKLFKAGVFEHEQDLLNLERYYAKHWPPDRDKNILRHDLITMLNNLPGEIDRANIWAERHPLKQPPRKIIPLPPVQSEPFVAPSDPESVAARERFLAEYQARKKQRGGLA